MPIIVNADDFGRSVAANAAICAAFRQGLISSATLMANMEGFEAAVADIRSLGVQGQVGVHLNLTEGAPLTAVMRAQRRLCGPDGRFRARARDYMRLGAGEFAAVRDELRAQVELCRSAGVAPSHLDSHHHSHTSWSAGTAVIAVAHELGIRHVRPAHNAGALISTKHKLYSALYNARLGRAGLRGVRHFCNLVSASPGLVAAGGSIEVMVHPYLHADGRVTDLEGGPLLAERVPLLVGAGRIVSYGDLS